MWFVEVHLFVVYAAILMDFAIMYFIYKVCDILLVIGFKRINCLEKKQNNKQTQLLIS